MSIMVAGMVVVGSLFSASPAWAHGAGETEEGYLLVQQALSHLAHDKTSSGIDLSMEKIGDALKTKDQEGVNVAEVHQAEAALEAGQVAKAQALLQHSITEAVSQLKPAIGEQTGTTLVLDPMPGRGSLKTENLGFLAMSVLLLKLGAGLAWRFRPPDSVRALRRRLETLPDQVVPPDGGAYGVWVMTATNPLSAPAELAQPRKGARRALDVIDERLGIKALMYPVPEHANRLAWSLGGVTAGALLILIATGALLVQFYNPVLESANESVRHVLTHVWSGRFVRGVHFWASQAMYVTALLHMLRVFLTGSYKKPREGNWLIGVGMFGLVTLGVFTGTVLKWDQEGFEALGHNLEIGKLVGGVGLWFTPDFASRIPVLIRLYGAHVVIVPGLILVLALLHALLVKRHGISPHPTLPTDDSGQQSPADEPTEPFTHHLRRIAAFAVALFGLLGILAVLVPPEIGPHPWPASRSPPRRGTSGGCLPWRTGSGWAASCTASLPSSRCWRSCPSSTATPNATGAGAR